MPRRHLLYHFDLENGRSCLPMEREYRQALEIRAYEDGRNNRHEFFYTQVLFEKSKDMPSAIFIAQAITKYPFEVSDKKRSAP